MCPSTPSSDPSRRSFFHVSDCVREKCSCLQNLTVSLSHSAISGGDGSRLLHDPGSTMRVDLMFCYLPRHRELVCLFKAQLDFAGSKKSVMAAGAIFFTMPMGGPFWTLSCFFKLQLDLGVPRGARPRSVVHSQQRLPRAWEIPFNENCPGSLRDSVLFLGWTQRSGSKL